LSFYIYPKSNKFIILLMPILSTTSKIITHTYDPKFAQWIELLYVPQIQQVYPLANAYTIYNQKNNHS